MRFNKYINEIKMSSDTKIEVTKRAHPYTIRISIDDGMDVFEVIGERFEDDEEVEMEGVGAFSGSIQRYKTGDIIKWWEVDFYDENGETDLAPKRKGVAIKLFAALPQAIKMFIKDKKPKDFRFSAKTNEPSRVRLYDRLSKMIKGYKLKRYTEKADNNYITWQFIK